MKLSQEKLADAIYGMTSCEDGFTEVESRKIAADVAAMYFGRIQTTVRAEERRLLASTPKVKRVPVQLLGEKK